MKPLIIISPSVNTNEDELRLSRAYFSAVRLSGGTALSADYGDIEELLSIADGILLSGGGDIEPELSNDESDYATQGQISRDRDGFEFELIKRAYERYIPILGICRGMQVIGAAFGSHIIQHMDGHMQNLPKNEASHYVLIDKSSLLYRITERERIMVNSFHHQAVGEGFRGLVSAISHDGYAEAVELPGRDFVLGVQWHPEHLTNTEENLKLFKAFIDAARRYRRCRYYGK